MGAACGNGKQKYFGNPELEKIPGQKMLMDNEEVTILKWKKSSLKHPKGKEPLANEFLQKQAYFVLPQIRDFQKEKVAFKKQLQIKEGDEVFTRFRIVNGGKDIAKSNNLYYINTNT